MVSDQTALRRPGPFEAIFRPPPRRYPQVAIISALTHEMRQGFVVLPLWGLGAAVIETSPRAVISVRVKETLSIPSASRWISARGLFWRARMHTRNYLSSQGNNKMTGIEATFIALVARKKIEPFASPSETAR